MRDTMEVAPLQELAAERLAAHRRRRYGFAMPAVDAIDSRRDDSGGGLDEAADAAVPERCGLPAGATRVREAVAERYRHSVSYREFLATEAARAVEQARAQVEIATRNVEAVAAAQTKLMEELELWPVEAHAVAQSQPGAAVTAVPTMVEPSAGPSMSTTFLSGALMSAGPMASVPGLRVRMIEPMPGSLLALPKRKLEASSEEAEVELESLDEEIAFRAAPEFEEHLLEPLTIQPNILEFPRQLVAARRVRPRLAEGPLRETSSQLRIFEVEAAAVSMQPMAGPAAAPGWQSLVLDAPVRESVTPVSSAAWGGPRPELKHRAPVALRCVALAVDVSWVGLTLVALVCGLVKAMGVPQWTNVQLAAGLGAALPALGLLYGLVFLSLAGATPGMMYAEIGLYQFDATDARRSTLQVWMLLTMLSALPAGLGLLWPIFDADGLGWQDRVCGVYSRLV